MPRSEKLGRSLQESAVPNIREVGDVREDQAAGEDLRFITEEDAFDLPQASWLRGFRCYFQQTRYSDDLFAQHGVPLPADLRSAVQGRRGEFLAGRYTALKALQRWGLEAGVVSIGRHRCPVWPVGLVGSITHDGATAISAVARAEDCTSLGIDLAGWLSDRDVLSLSGYIVQPEEARVLADCALPYARAVTLAFSAKESLFKALYPLVGAYFDFHAIELLSFDLSEGQFWARTRTDLSSSMGAGAAVHGAFLLGGGTVFTAAWLPGGTPRI